jgi:sec-independent protein translocase protein TatB
MLGVGWTEMLVIGVVALIVIGPKELPALMHRVGKFAGTIRRMGSDFQRELNKTTGLNEIANLRQSVTQPLKATADAIRKEFNTTTATGEVKPSGAIKPADPKVESVVDEIKAAAGIATPVAAAAPVMTPIAQPAEAPKAPVKAARPATIKAPTESKVATADIAPVKKAAPKTNKPIDSPAPVEAIAPAKASPAKQARVEAITPAQAAPGKKATVKAAKPVAKAESIAAKPAAKAAPAKTVKPTAAEPAAAKKPAAKKPAAAAKKP